jgi:hypothetical protein
MKRIGYLLITLAFLATSYIAVIETRAVPWSLFVPVFLVGVAGVALARIGARRHARGEDKLETDIQAIDESVGRLVENLRTLNRERHDLDVYEMRHRVDELLRDDLTAFADARESIAHRYGIQAYADVMNSFAAGERYVNRVWSASADGYREEVDRYLEKAEKQMEEALHLLQSLKAAA